MRVLLVTLTDQLPGIFSILNPKLEFRAIVVDEVEPAKKILEQVGLPKDLLYPLYELKECIKDFHYDCLLCVTDSRTMNILSDQTADYGLPHDKFVHLNDVVTAVPFSLKISLDYYKRHAAEIQMFATGISYTGEALIQMPFKKKLINLAYGSQDLYYDYKVAKQIVLCGGGYSKLHYALIGLAPYSFLYDLSKGYLENFRLLRYLIALDDLHNFWMSKTGYASLFNKNFLSFQPPPTEIDVNLRSPGNIPVQLMGYKERLASRERIEVWTRKNYPETRAENVKILDDYLTLCEENNIRPVMFLPPMTEGFIKYFHKQKLEEFYYLVGQACKKHPSAVFIDGWKLQGLTDADFRDVDHVNIIGAAKFSTFLNSVIEQLDGH